MKLLSNSGAILLISIILSLSAISCKKSKPTPSQETIDAIKSEQALLRNRLPIEGGVGLIITDVDFDDATNTIEYKYQFTLPGAQKPSDSQLSQAKEVAIALTKSQPREMKMLAEGISFSYDYYSLDDEYLYSMEVTGDGDDGIIVNFD